MRKYVAYQVQGECEDGVRNGWRSFIATCGDPYYRGRSYRDALAVYKDQVRYTDGIHYAVILMGYDPENDEWVDIKHNEINKV